MAVLRRSARLASNVNNAATLDTIHATTTTLASAKPKRNVAKKVTAKAEDTTATTTATTTAAATRAKRPTTKKAATQEVDSNTDAVAPATRAKRPTVKKAAVVETDSAATAATAATATAKGKQPATKKIIVVNLGAATATATAKGKQPATKKASTLKKDATTATAKGKQPATKKSSTLKKDATTATAKGKQPAKTKASTVKKDDTITTTAKENNSRISPATLMADIIEIIKAADAATAAIKAERAKKAKAARENRKKTGSLAIGRKRPFEEVVDASNAEPAPAIPLEVIKDAPRPQKYRRHVTKLIAERIERACKQRMFLLAREQQSELKQAFTVLGNSQKVYTVTICDIPTCTCMDKIFNRDIHCKHVLFVMIKVLRVPHNNPLIWQRALVPSELRAIFAHATPDLAVAGKEASRKAKRAGLLLKKQKMLKRVRKFAPTVIRRPIEGDCPICYEELVETDSYNPIVWCQLGCGNNLHRVCFNQWKKMEAASNKKVTCVYCRKSWIKDHNPKKEETASKPVREISNAMH